MDAEVKEYKNAEKNQANDDPPCKIFNRTYHVKRKTSKRKSMPKTKFNRSKNRRCKANARERNRMHSLNAALDTLREYIPIQNKSQKLSKIETLRLARNYIVALSETLQYGTEMDTLTFAKILSKQMSPPTVNAIATVFDVNRSFLPQEKTKPSFHSDTNLPNAQTLSSLCLADVVLDVESLYAEMNSSFLFNCKVQSDLQAETLTTRCSHSMSSSVTDDEQGSLKAVISMDDKVMTLSEFDVTASVRASSRKFQIVPSEKEFISVQLYHAPIFSVSQSSFDVGSGSLEFDSFEL